MYVDNLEKLKEIFSNVESSCKAVIQDPKAKPFAKNDAILSLRIISALNSKKNSFEDYYRLMSGEPTAPVYCSYKIKDEFGGETTASMSISARLSYDRQTDGYKLICQLVDKKLTLEQNLQKSGVVLSEPDLQVFSKYGRLSEVDVMVRKDNETVPVKHDIQLDKLSGLVYKIPSEYRRKAVNKGFISIGGNYDDSPKWAFTEGQKSALHAGLPVRMSKEQRDELVRKHPNRQLEIDAVADVYMEYNVVARGFRVVTNANILQAVISHDQTLSLVSSPDRGVVQEQRPAEEKKVRGNRSESVVPSREEVENSQEQVQTVRRGRGIR